MDEVTSSPEPVIKPEGDIAPAPLVTASVVTSNPVATNLTTRVAAEAAALSDQQTDTTYPEGSVESILLHHFIQRSRHSSDLLKTHLTGVVQLNLVDIRDKYHIDLREMPPKVRSERSGLASTGAASNRDLQVEPECTLTMDSVALKAVARGNLNPQLAMLSGKIKVAGRSTLAVYIFNLIAPRDRL